MIIPKLEKDQFVLIRAKSSTGQLINLDGTFYFDGVDKEYYEVMNGKEDAVHYANELVRRNSEIEVVIYDYKEECLGVFRTALEETNNIKKNTFWDRILNFFR